jgi:hypothetical protein
MQVSPVALSCPSPRTAAPSCLPLDISLTEGGHKDFCFGAFALGAFALGFWLLDFWLFGVGGFWK